MFRLIVPLICALWAVPASAETELPTPDVIACLKGTVPLDRRYRSWMQVKCFGVAGDICHVVDKGTGPCMGELSRRCAGSTALWPNNPYRKQKTARRTPTGAPCKPLPPSSRRCPNAPTKAVMSIPHANFSTLASP